jgi:hypothetical protein
MVLICLFEHGRIWGIMGSMSLVSVQQLPYCKKHTCEMTPYFQVITSLGNNIFPLNLTHCSGYLCKYDDQEITWQNYITTIAILIGVISEWMIERIVEWNAGILQNCLLVLLFPLLVPNNTKDKLLFISSAIQKTMLSQFQFSVCINTWQHVTVT